MEEHDKKISDTLYVIKALAILTVASAHCVYQNLYAQRLANLIGTIGVPAFLIVAGYYFNKEERWDILAKKKIKRIVLPWIFMGGVHI